MHLFDFIPHFTAGFAIPPWQNLRCGLRNLPQKKKKQLLTEAGKIPQQVICKQVNKTMDWLCWCLHPSCILFWGDCNRSVCLQRLLHKQRTRDWRQGMCMERQFELLPVNTHAGNFFNKSGQNQTPPSIYNLSKLMNKICVSSIKYQIPYEQLQLSWKIFRLVVSEFGNSESAFGQFIPRRDLILSDQSAQLLVQAFRK